MSYIETAGLKLPSDPSGMTCLPYLKNLLWCYGPTGVWTGVYREGAGTSCVGYLDRFITCAQVKVTPSTEKQIALLEEANQRLQKETKLPDKAPVWNLRKEPPPQFHDYQTLTQEEEEKFWLELKHHRCE